MAKERDAPAQAFSLGSTTDPLCFGEWVLGVPFDELQSRPRHKVDGEVRYTLPWGTVARAAVSYVAGTFVYTRNEPYRQKRLSSYTLGTSGSLIRSWRGGSSSTPAWTIFSTESGR